MNIPEETRWLLAFLNVGKTAGKLNPSPFTIGRWKHKPELPDGAKTHLLEFDTLVTDKKWIWDKATGKCVCKAPWYSLLSDREILEAYADVTGDKIKLPGEITIGDVMASENKEVIKQTSGLFTKTLFLIEMSLYNYIIKDGDPFGLLAFFTCSRGIHPDGKFQDGRTVFKSNAFPQIAEGYLMDFIVNQKELHSRLRMCDACGQFWIAEKKRGRGRPQIFCTPKCKKVFNRPSKQEQAKRMRDYRKARKKIEKRKECGEAAKFLFHYMKKEGMGLKYSSLEKRAEAKARELIYKRGKTLKQIKEGNVM